jgi:diguanylate cyclase (GGDEF)-like protein/PAS domain S-box-containing protein
LQFRVGASETECVWLEARAGVATLESGGEPLEVARGTLHDISDSRRAQRDRDRDRAQDLYAALSATSEAIARIREPQVLFDEMCRIAVQHGRFRLAFIGQHTPDSDQLRIAAQAGEKLDYLTSLRASAREDSPLGMGPIGHSLRSMRSCVWNDFLAEPGVSPWRDSASRAGLYASASVPIRCRGAIWGVLVLYSAERGYFDAPLVRLLEEMTEHLGLALEQFERERELRAIEARLLDSQALAEGVLNAAIDPIICLDDSGRIIALNPAAERTFGWRGADTLGRPFVEILVPPRFRAERIESLARFLATGESQFVNLRRETLAWCQDGTELPVEIATIATRIDTRLILTLYLRDISESKRDQQILKEIASRYRQLVERSPEALLVHRDGRLLLANKACQRLLGVSHENQLLDRDLFEFIRPDQHALVRQRIAAKTSGEPSRAFFSEQIWLRIDGTEVVVEAAGTRVDYEGQIAHQVVLRDVTDRKRAQKIQERQNHVLSLIAGEALLPEILLQLVTFIEAQSPRTRASVMLLSSDGTRLEQCVAPSLPPLLRSAIDPMPVGPASAVCGTAAFRGEPVIVRDLSQDALTLPLTPIAQAHEVGAAASWPIMGKRGQILGTFALYYRVPSEPNPFEMSLIALATDLAGIAIESRLADERIRYLAHYDDLTSLPNRFLFKQLLELGLAKARRQDRKLATMFLDLDRFKNINDTFGHGVGDDVLREVGARFRACLRETDQIARMGGDEFFILLEDIERPGEITEVARRILDVAARPFFIKGEECQLSASIGVAVYPDDGEDGDTLLKNADIAMYRAKAQGKNTFQFYSASKNIHSVQRMSLEARLRRAIENREFVLHYQPRVDLQNGQIKGVEALVRWEHPERGLLLPAEFISIAEETGLIVPLGRNILEMAVNDARRFEFTLGRILRTAVNLSVRQLDESNFVEETGDLLRSRGLDASALELELTESMLIHNPDHAERVVGELRAMGIAVSIDDFGTGFSSLTYLKRFPVETVKIDRSFIKDLPGDSNDLAITQAIIAMSHSLGLKVVAEGVETEEQASTLRRMDCDEYQGFLFSKAVPIDALLKLILRMRAAA